ncbi:MAG TPA: hypothetical protein PLU72_13025 [Candidatus Ozemobacteraceae bacterium]|nr:hypothetical protein [Candidatus Ozemobacteraceae bacterium]
MKNETLFRSVLGCAIALMFLLCSPAFSQSLEDIIQNRPADEPPAVQQSGSQEAPVAPAATVTNEPATDVESYRRKIIEIAETMLGKVRVNDAGEDGNKVGWQHLKKFYEVAYRYDDLEKAQPQWMPLIKGVGKKVNEWCGIFGTWAWRSAGIPVYWNTKIMGCKYHGKKDRLAPGDIVVMTDKPAPPPKPGEKPKQPLYHHCIVKSINGNTMMTINGNAGMDSVKLAERKVSDISIIYSVEDALGVKPSTPAATQGQGQTTKPTPSAGQGTGSATKPPASTKPSGAPSAGKPAPTSAPAQKQEPLSQKELDDLIGKVMMLIKITLGQFF